MSVSHKVFCAYISFNISKLILSRSTLKWNCLLLIMLKTPSFSKVVRLLLEEWSKYLLNVVFSQLLLLKTCALMAWSV